MTIRLTREAELDLIEIEVYYLREGPQLADDFTKDLFKYLDLICKQPDSGSRLTDRYRKFLMKRFPCYIVYEWTPGMLVVIQLVHDKRHPRVQYKRIK